MFTKLMTRFLATSSLIISLICCLPVFSSSAYAEELGHESAVSAVLVSSSGEVREIYAEPVLAPSVKNADGSYSQVYDFYVLSSDLTHVASQFDDTKAVKATLAINLTTQGSSVLLTGVSGYWEIYDSWVSVKSAYLRYACNGPQAGETQSRERSVSNNFSYSTGFNIYVSPGWTAVGANLTLTLQESGKPQGETWTLFLQNNYDVTVPGPSSVV